MASSSGTSSGLSMVHNSGSEEDLQVLMDQRKRKRMISNRESARRSRMRKQKHLDELMTQVTQLRKENHQIVTSLAITTQHYLSVEAENSIMRAQVNELSHRLQSLNEIINFLNVTNVAMDATESNPFHLEPTAADYHSFFNPLSMAYMNQPIMAASDTAQY